MRFLRRTLSRVAGVFQSDRHDRELSAELESHVQLHVDHGIRSGLTPQEARRRALLQLGGVEQTREHHRDRRGLPSLDTLLRDVRDGWRRLRRTPGTAAAVVVTLAACLGANASVFAVADALTRRPFSFPDVDRVVFVEETQPDWPWLGVTSAPNFLDWRERVTTIRQLTAMTLRTTEISGDGDPERLQTLATTADFFDLMRMPPALGRGFLADEETEGRNRRVVLGHGLWERRFASDPSIVGQSIVLNGMPHEVVGVAQRGFNFPFNREIYVPLAFGPQMLESRGDRLLLVLGRLQEEATLTSSRSELEGIAASLGAEHPADLGTSGAQVRILREGFTEAGMSTLHGFLQAAALFVLLIACANIANLLLALSVDRQREMAVRFAMGATRPRIFRGLWTETLLLAFVAVPLALGLAAFGLDELKTTLPQSLAGLPGWQNIRVDSRVWTFTILLAVGAAAMFGLLPALYASRPSPEVLKEGARSLTANVTSQRVRRALIVAQVSLVLPLLVAAAAVWQGTSSFVNGPQGFDPDNLLTFDLTLPERQYANDDAQRAFVDQLIERLQTSTGVRAATVANVLPSRRNNETTQVQIVGRAIPQNEQQDRVDRRVVSPNYFSAMGIAVRRGRSLTTDDRDGTQPVAVISQTMAERYWPGEDAIGRQLRDASDGETVTLTVVGVVDDVVHDWTQGRNPPALYRPYAQVPVRDFAVGVRTAGEPSAASALVQGVLREIDAGRPLSNLSTMRQNIDWLMTAPRQVTMLMASLGVLALVLAGIGLYGVTAHMVSQRTHEIGMRMVLGASPGAILRVVLGQAWAVIAFGVALGLVFALAAARVIESSLFGIASVNAPTVAGIVAVVAGAGIVAAFVPARRAISIEPIVALRQE